MQPIEKRHSERLVAFALHHLPESETHDHERRYAEVVPLTGRASVSAQGERPNHLRQCDLFAARIAPWSNALRRQFAGEALIAANGTSISQATPDGSNDRRTAPWSWLTKLCWMRRVPKPRRFGELKGGPPTSFHLRQNWF